MSDIYVKPAKKVILSGAGRSHVTIGDVAEVIAPKELAPKIKTAALFKPEVTKKKRHYLVSVTDIIKAAQEAAPSATINNVGESDTIVEYYRKPKRDFKTWRWIKAVTIGLVLMVGSATAIMSFHADAQLPEVFRNIYYIFFRERVDNPLIIEIPYAIGVAVGITAFYNHFAGKKLTDDPTPIQVEMAVYDTEVTDAIIDAINAKKTNAEQREKTGELS